MSLRRIGSRAQRRLRREAAATLLAAMSVMCAAPAHALSLKDRVNRLVDLGFDRPQHALELLKALKAQSHLTPEAQRVIETGIGLVAADNSMRHEALAAATELDRLVASAGRIAHADALLVVGDLELSTAETNQAAVDTVAAVAAYAPYCDAVLAADTSECSSFDWFWANMFAGLALSDKTTRASAGTYLQAAGAIAETAHRPDLEAKPVAVAAELAQDEGNVELCDRLLRRADLLAVRSGVASSQEFVKMFAAEVLQDRGELADASVKLQDAMDIAKRSHHGRRVVELADDLVQVELKQGHTELALQRIASTMVDAEVWGAENIKDLLRIKQVVALLRLRRLDEARRLLAPFLDSLDARLRPADRGDVIDTLGNALIAAGAMDDAMSLFQREQQSLLAAGNNEFERTMLAWQADLNTRRQLQRQAEMRRWGAAAAVALNLLLAVSAMVPWQRSRNRRLARANEALREQSERDQLTGLLNRDGLLRGLQERGRAQSFTGTLLLVDIDHFKNINDTLGHAGGDAVLREIALRLQSCLREGDFVVRWGGEELVVAVLSTPFDADALVDRILQSFAAAPISFQQRSISVSASIGYATFPLDEPDVALSFDASLAVADAGMYYAKRHGRRAAVRITSLPPALLDDQGGLPDAVEREAHNGAVRLVFRRAPEQDKAQQQKGMRPASVPLVF